MLAPLWANAKAVSSPHAYPLLLHTMLDFSHSFSCCFIIICPFIYLLPKSPISKETCLCCSPMSPYSWPIRSPLLILILVERKEHFHLSITSNGLVPILLLILSQIKCFLILKLPWFTEDAYIISPWLNTLRLLPLPTVKPGLLHLTPKQSSYLNTCCRSFLTR